MSEKNSYESFAEDVNGCLESISTGCGVIIMVVLGSWMLVNSAAWVRDHIVVSVGVAVAIVGGIIYLVRREQR